MGSIPYVVEDCHGIVQIFSDGSIHRHENIDFSHFQVIDDGSVFWKDYCYDKKNNLSLRIYTPKTATKLPVIYFLHGGGFCLGSFKWPNFHNCCLRLASALHVIVVAPDYRLAPEHRLPAAVDDSLGALFWLQMAPKLGGQPSVDFFGFDRFFVIGDSSGGNIAHHLAVRLGPSSPELGPIKIRGYVMLAPFFGGTERTASEVEGLPEKVLTVELLDTFWRMSLPVGNTMDHPFANPFGSESRSLDLIKLDPILVMVGGDEIMKDRVKLYAERLKEVGKTAHYVEFKGKQHGFFTHEPYSDVSESVLNLIKDFMSEQSR
ncbi:strigolactones hydrolase CXE15-like [Rutidosis leptorrhynchoides]|uniref:strigolactones hydrolase CXE15-like n=1 Tax=Rutidosis leptorrhynchoides TaxID=125765 RepID=UPI003A99F1F8